MRFVYILIAAAVAPAAGAQTALPDSQIAQILVTEIRGLRQDLRNTAATIQRVQIVLYRLQSQTEIGEKTVQRLDEVRDRCRQLETQESSFRQEIAQAEARKQNAQNESARAQAEQWVSQFQSGLEALAGQVQQCQAEQAEAENQARGEQAKRDQLSDQLDQLDQAIGSQSSTNQTSANQTNVNPGSK